MIPQMLTFGIEYDIIIIENKLGGKFMDLETLKFQYNEKKEKLETLRTDVFTLNYEIVELIMELAKIKEEIERIENKED